MKLNPDYIESVKNKNENASESESESENESKFSIGKTNEIWRNIETDLDKENQRIQLPETCLPNNFHPNGDAKLNIENVTVQNSSNTLFGNKTVYNAPVTINHFVNDELSKFDENYLNKYKCMQYSRKKVVLTIISAILIFLSIFTLIYILIHKNDEPFGK